MLNQAIQKLKTEMDKHKNNTYIQVVGNFLLQHLESNPGAAEKIMTQDKTISKSLDEMKKVAQKKQAGGYTVLTDQDGFEVVLKYYGIGSPAVMAPVPPAAPAVAPVKPSVDFDVNLDDLL